MSMWGARQHMIALHAVACMPWCLEARSYGSHWQNSFDEEMNKNRACLQHCMHLQNAGMQQAIAKSS